MGFGSQGSSWWAVAVFTFGVIGAPRTGSGQDHYCGVYAAYCILDHYGKEVDFDTLLEPRYIAGYGGSTAPGIAAALTDHGLQAWYGSGLGVVDLKIASGPVILHVRGSQQTREYRHWVCYLGERDGEAVVLDPSRGQNSMSYARLLALWDGVAVAADESGWTLKAWRLTSLLLRWGVVILLGCVCGLLVGGIDRWVLPRASRGLVRSSVGGAVLLLAMSGLGLGIDALDPHGLMQGAAARSCITSVHAPARPREMSVQEALQRHGVSNGAHQTIWIDARFGRDYGLGHIPGALSLPIDAQFDEEDAVVSRIPRDAEVVVYCQSAGCAFADAVSERLAGHGFQTIRLLAGGFVEWESAGGSVDPPRPGPKSADVVPLNSEPTSESQP